MKIDREEIGQRIKNALGNAKITQRQLSQALGVKDPSVTAYIQGSSNLPAEAYSVISELCDVSIDWIITGKESQRGGINDNNLTQINKGKALPGGKIPEGYVKSDVYLLGGAGNPHDLSGYEPIDVLFLPQEYLKPGILPIKISGRSMEPILFNGAYVGVDKEERQVISGEVYAVHLPYEGTVIKRIYMSVDHVILKSDNPSFPELSIPIEKINPDNFILGRVKWVLQRI